MTPRQLAVSQASPQLGFTDETALETNTLRAAVKGDMDPGYGSTSKMIAEAAVSLVKNPTLTAGGIMTPAAALGGNLIERLQDNAGLTFQLEEK